MMLTAALALGAPLHCVADESAALSQVQAEIDLLRREHAAMQPLIDESRSLLAEMARLTDSMTAAQIVQETSAQRRGFLFELTRLESAITLEQVSLDGDRWTVSGRTTNEAAVNQLVSQLSTIARMDGKGWPMRVDLGEITEPDASGLRRFVLVASEVGDSSRTESAPPEVQNPSDPIPRQSPVRDVEEARAERDRLLREFEDAQQSIVQLDILRMQIDTLGQIARHAGLPRGHCPLEALAELGLTGGLAIDTLSYGAEESRDGWYMRPIHAQLVDQDFVRMVEGMEFWLGMMMRCGSHSDKPLLTPVRLLIVGVGDGAVTAELTLQSARGVPGEE